MRLIGILIVGSVVASLLLWVAAETMPYEYTNSNGACIRVNPDLIGDDTESDCR